MTQYPLALAKVPPAVLEGCDTLYVKALCASKGSADVVALLPTEDEERLCRAAFEKDPVLIGLLPACERTAERCKEACIRQPQMMVHVPYDVQTEEFLQQLCDKKPDCFCELQESQKTKSLAMRVCKIRGYLLKEIAPERRDKELCEVACRADAAAIALVPEDICTEAFCQRLVNRCHMPLKYIPEAKITAQMCKTACALSPEALGFVPVKLKTDALYDEVLKSTRCYLAFPYLPLHKVPAGKCQEICQQYGSDLANVPDALKNEKLYRIASQDAYWNLCDIPKIDRSRDLCLKSGVDRKCDFASVPDGHINLRFLFSVMGGKDDLDLHTRAQKWLSVEDYSTFLCVSALYRTETQLKLLTWSALPGHFRRRLIDFLSGQGEPISLQNMPKLSLINRHSPLRFNLYNPLVSKLLYQAHTARHYRPTCQADGQAWLHYFNGHKLRYLAAPLPLIDDALYEPLKRGHIEPMGGRTLQVQKGDRVYYYKFQRKDEKLEDLLREGLIHQFRAEHRPGAWAKLASDLPTDPHFFALPKSLWPQHKDDLKDEVEEQKESGREPWVNVYRYTASADYGRYAHQPDRAADCPWKKPEQAILTACSDMGLFASMGLMLTSMLPAMHNSEQKRSWQPLYDLFGYFYWGEVHPGTLGAWNGRATEHCDIGFNGLRDVGDYEQFGAIRSCFAKSDNEGTAQPVQIGQRLAVVSTLCDNVMAAILIRSRLRQQDSGYHYSHNETVAETARFIGDVCDHLLSGLAGKGKSEVLPGMTRKTMTQGKKAYGNWLKRAAFEIVYWTARQPGLNSAKLALLGHKKVDHDWNDGYIGHLQEAHNLPDTLYNPADFRPRRSRSYSPDCFRNPNGEDNLGAHNEAFPLTTLVQGLTSLGGDILEKWSLHASTEVDDPTMEVD